MNGQTPDAITIIPPTPPTAPLVRQDITIDRWKVIEAIAPAMHASRLFGLSSAEQGMAIMLKGYELGLTLTASFEMIHMIQNKPSLSPRGALALIIQSGQLADIKIDEKPDRCTVTMVRVNGRTYTTSFSIDDAKRAGLIKPDSAWSSYPANMLRWRTIGFCADVVFPDVLAGMRRADELGAAIDGEGNVVEANDAS